MENPVISKPSAKRDRICPGRKVGQVGQVGQNLLVPPCIVFRYAPPRQRPGGGTGGTGGGAPLRGSPPLSPTGCPGIPHRSGGALSGRAAGPIAALAVGLALASTAAHADPCEAPLPKRGAVFEGRVAYVGDGDSLCVTSPAGLVEVRLADYFAPELSEPGGPQAKAALSRISMGRRVVCRAQNRSYDRIVVRCTLNGTDIGDLMRRAGQAEGGRGFR
jgi:micrococcal nuclease